MANNNTFSFPSHLVDSDKKDKNWISQYIRAAYYDFNSYYPNQLYNGRDKMHEIKLYMLGKQPISRYKPLLGLKKTANADESWANISWDILPIIPKFRRLALSKLIKSDFNIEIDAIDAFAQDDKNKFFAENAAKLTLREEFKKKGLEEDLIPPPDVDAENMQELDMFMNYSYKHRMAIEMEMSIKLVLSLNAFPESRERVIEDLFDWGIGGYKEYFDKNQIIKTRRVNPQNLIMSYTTDPYLKDVQYVGEVLEMTISDLKAIAGNEISEEEYYKLAEQYSGKLNNPTFLNEYSSDHNRNYDKFRIRVLDLEFYSNNSIILEERVNSKGNTVVGRASKLKPSKNGKSYSKTDYKVVYQGMWVIGTETFFGCQLQTNMKRAKSSLTDTTLSYHLVAPNIYQMSTYSMGEQTMTIADQIQLAWYKLQNVMLRARPRGIMIEIGALENVPIGKAGQQMKPLDIIDLYNQTGNLVYRRLDEQGQASNYKPIEELNNGIGSEAGEYFAIINNNIQMLRDILGFNEITDGSTPDPRTLNGVAKFASESTNNSLDFILRGERDLLERLCYNITLRIQDAAQSGKLEGYIKALGSGTVQFFKADANVSAHEYGLIVKQKPNEFEKEKFARRVEQAIQAGQITLADAMLIENVDNLKYAEVLLSYKIKKNTEDAQNRAMQQQQMNAQVQQQAAMASEQAKQQTIQMETQSKLAIIEREKQLEMQVKLAELQMMAQIEQMKVDGKINMSQIESSSREYVQQIKNEKVATSKK